MIRSDNVSITQIEELLASNGYEVTEAESGVIRVRDLETGVSFQAALEGNVLYMTVKLTTMPAAEITAGLMRKMLASDNGFPLPAFSYTMPVTARRQ
jgi:CheY-like chemotaxis protein